MSYNNLKKIKIIKNDKKPVEKWSKKENQYLNIDTDLYNVGIITGKINDLIILDIDLKNDGLNEFNKTFKLNDFKTPIAQTQSGGYHIYFKYNNSNKNLQYIIDNFLKNKSGYRNKGIDIRSNGGYILAPPSHINNNKYKWINSYNKYNVMEITEDLLNWLLIDIDTTKEINNNNNNVDVKIKNELIYNITDEQIKEVLNKLPNEYLNDFNKWIYVLSALKNLNKYEIFDDWSKQSKNYNSKNNLKLWSSNNGKIDIGYICYLVDYKITSYKVYNPLENNIECKKYIINNKYLNDGIKDLNEDFNKSYNTFIYQSTTGTGKTTHTSEQVNILMNKNKKLKFISIVARISLATQLKENFKDINLKSYLDTPKEELLKNNIVICINSLMLLNNLSKYEMNNYILYIDEINSFLESITHNETLKGKIKIIHRILINLVKNCKILIVSDALISDNVFNFLNIRDINKMVYIKNEFIKYTGIKAIEYKDENLFIEQLRYNIKNKNYFWYGNDSSTIITEHYNLLIREFEEQAKDFILITAETKYIIKDINDLKNKYILYSPSITYSVDFSIKEKQDVFIYISNKSILSSGIFQQTTRTRNINKLYFYGKDVKRTIKYNNLNDVETHYKDLINIKNKLLDEFIDVDEFGDENINDKGLFYKLFCYNEYVRDIYKNNITEHYRQILLKNGFIIEQVGEKKLLDKDLKDYMKTLNIMIKEDNFFDFVYCDDETKEHLRFFYLNEKLRYLQINKTDKETIIKFKDILINKNGLSNYYNTIKLLSNDYMNNHKHFILKVQDIDITNLSTIESKILIFKKVCLNLNNMEPLNLDYYNDDKINLDDKTFILLKKVFELNTKNKPSNLQEFKKIHSKILNDITGGLYKSFKSKKRDETRDKLIYKIDTELLNKYLDLHFITNSNREHIDKKYIEMFNITIQEKNYFREIEEIEYIENDKVIKTTDLNIINKENENNEMINDIKNKYKTLKKLYCCCDGCINSFTYNLNNGFVCNNCKNSAKERLYNNDEINEIIKIETNKLYKL